MRSVEVDGVPELQTELDQIFVHVEVDDDPPVRCRKNV